MTHFNLEKRGQRTISHGVGTLLTGTGHLVNGKMATMDKVSGRIVVGFRQAVKRLLRGLTPFPFLDLVLLPLASFVALDS